jgi:hypothetical protein
VFVCLLRHDLHLLFGQSRIKQVFFQECRTRLAGGGTGVFGAQREFFVRKNKT